MAREDGKQIYGRAVRRLNKFGGGGESLTAVEMSEKHIRSGGKIKQNSDASQILFTRSVIDLEIFISVIVRAIN